MALFGLFKSADKTAETQDPLEISEAETPVEAAPIAAPEFDFEEFAAPEPTVEADEEPILEAEAEPLDLEEWSEPLPTAAPEILAPETVVELENGALKIEEHLETRGAENIYRARWQRENAEAETTYLREASGAGSERLGREAMWRAHWDATTRIAMLPRLVAQGKTGDNHYLATEMPTAGPNLAEFFAVEETKSERDDAAFLSETSLILAQVAAFLVRLHEAGFAHLGLRPELVVPGKPMQVLDCSFAAPVGEPLEAPLSFVGYSAPELSQPALVDARSDFYAVGALLYRAVTGENVPETGVDFTTWQPRIVMAGVPQILRRTLGPLDTRFNSADELHRALVKLKNRLRPAISTQICGLSTIGLEPSRATNQDAFGFLNGAWETENGPATWAAFCVADGMGGMAAGEVASEIAVNTFLQKAALWAAEAGKLNQEPPTALVQASLVKEWAGAANEAVVKTLEARHVRGGCTLDAGFVLEKRLCIAHIGDARIYLFRGGEFEVLSRDHSYVMSLLLQGEISFEEIRTHKERNKITRSLGERHPQPDYFVDSLQITKNAPSLELQNGDVLMACSDGLWEPVLEAEMIAALESGDLENAARQMLKLALQRGAPDNATLVLLRLEERAAPVFAGAKT